MIAMSNGVDHRIAFEPAPVIDSSPGRSGLLQTFLLVEIDNLEMSSSYEISIA